MYLYVYIIKTPDASHLQNVLVITVSQQNPVCYVMYVDESSLCKLWMKVPWTEF